MNKTTFDTQDINPMEIAKLLAEAKTETAAKAIAAMFGLEYKDESKYKSRYNESVGEFLATIGDVNGKKVKEIYNQYLEFCKDQNYTPKPLRGFSRYVNQERNCKIENKICDGESCGFFIDIYNPIEISAPVNNAVKTISEFIASEYFLKFAKVSDYNNQVNIFVYDVYCAFCKKQGYEATNKITFGQNFTALTGYRAIPRRVNGVIRRVYIKVK